MSNFHSTRMGKAYYEHHIPTKTRTLEAIAVEFNKSNKLKEIEIEMKERELKLKEKELCLIEYKMDFYKNKKGEL